MNMRTKGPSKNPDQLPGRPVTVSLRICPDMLEFNVHVLKLDHQNLISTDSPIDRFGKLLFEYLLPKGYKR